MIPGPLISWQMLLLMFVLPALGVLLAVALAGYAGWYFLGRKGSVAAFFSWKVRLWSVLVLLLCGWTVFLAAKLQQVTDEIALNDWYKQRRRSFVLERDFQFGELHVPRGTLVNRYDPFDNGEPLRPVELRGLERLQFPQPVQVAGVWATQLETSATRVTLAHDQRIGPVYRFDDDNGGYARDTSTPHLGCKAGDDAWFNVPLIEYDIVAEFGVPEPDGPQARFKPSQWQLLRCGPPDDPIRMLPAFHAAGPKGAQDPVFLEMDATH